MVSDRSGYGSTIIVGQFFLRYWSSVTWRPYYSRVRCAERGCIHGIFSFVMLKILILVSFLRGNCRLGSQRSVPF